MRPRKTTTRSPSATTTSAAFPDRAEEAGIIAIPTLIRSWPLPITRLIGALSIKSRVVAGLGITSFG